MCEFNYQVFVSYARDDRSQVQTIVDALKSIGLKVWLDDDGIPPGVNFPVAIMEALRESRHLVVAVSTHTKSSLWQSQEVSQFLAMQNQRQQRSAEPSRRLLIVVVLAPPPPEQEWPTFIPENLNRITLGDGDDLQQKEAMRRLLDTCRLPGLIPDNDPDTRPRIDELITSPNDPLTYIGQLLELVDNLGGRVSYSMSGLDYGNYHRFFESIPATRKLLGKPGSPLRQQPMTDRLTEYLYPGRLRRAESPEAAQGLLKQLTKSVNDRRTLFRQLLSGNYNSVDYYAREDVDKLIAGLFVRTFQPACEVLERLNTIERYLDDYNSYRLMVFPEDQKPFFDSFLVKSLTYGSRTIRFTLRLGGSPEHDEFMIVTDDQQDVEYETALRALDDAGQGIESAAAFREWVDNDKLQKVRSVTCPRGLPCLKDNAPYCPSASCPASGFTVRDQSRLPLLYEDLERSAEEAWRKKDGDIEFRFDQKKIEFGITLVAGYPFEFTDPKAADDLEDQLHNWLELPVGEQSDGVILFPRECWHSTIVAFRRSRARPYTDIEIPDLSVLNHYVSEVQPFEARFMHLTLGKAGEIVLCGFLSDQAVSEVNRLRNLLICDITPQWDGTKMLHLRENTDPPKQRLAFHTTIGNLQGEFSQDRIRALRRTARDWLSTPLVSQVDTLRRVHYRNRNLCAIDEPVVEYPLG